MSVLVLNEAELRSSVVLDKLALGEVEKAFTWLASGMVSAPSSSRDSQILKVSFILQNRSDEHSDLLQSSNHQCRCGGNQQQDHGHQTPGRRLSK